MNATKAVTRFVITAGPQAIGDANAGTPGRDACCSPPVYPTPIYASSPV